MRVTNRAGVLALVAVIFATGIAAGSAGDPSPLSTEVVQAFATLAEPSAPRPLPTSVAGSREGEFTDGLSCAQVADEYTGADAPIPAGATVTASRYGALRVDAPFGPAAIFTAPTESGCTYSIRTAPALRITGIDLPAVSALEPVNCGLIFNLAQFAYAEFDLDGLTYSVVVGQAIDLGAAGPYPYEVSVAQVPLEALVGQRDLPTGALTVSGLTGTYDDLVGTLTVTGNGSTGPLEVSLQCGPNQLPTLF